MCEVFVCSSKEKVHKKPQGIRVAILSACYLADAVWWWGRPSVWGGGLREVWYSSCGSGEGYHLWTMEYNNGGEDLPSWSDHVSPRGSTEVFKTNQEEEAPGTGYILCVTWKHRDGLKVPTQAAYCGHANVRTSHTCGGQTIKTVANNKHLEALQAIGMQERPKSKVQVVYDYGSQLSALFQDWMIYTAATAINWRCSVSMSNTCYIVLVVLVNISKFTIHLAYSIYNKLLYME